jgi:hypothetical protein
MRETPELIQEYADLEKLFHQLKAIHPGVRNLELFRKTVDRLAEIDATPPDGYSLPAAAQKLVDCATAHGWRHSIRWTYPGYEGDPFVRVLIGRVGDDTGNWEIQYTWHSRGCDVGKVRLFGHGLMTSPGHQVSYSAPSLTAARKLIVDNPVTES